MLELLLSIALTQPLSGSVSTEPFLKQESINELQLKLSPLAKSSDTNIQIPAKSYLAIDVANNNILFEKDSNIELPMASLTKIMTALIILENHKLNEVVQVSKEATQVEGSKIWLLQNERMTVENLLKALLIKSGNDAALALSEYHSGTTELFIQEMNKRAQELGMKHTNFKNPHGLDDDNHYSSAKDILSLTQKALNFPFFQTTVNTKETTIESLSYIPRKIINTNSLLGKNVHGVKTGTTQNAGQCLVLLVTQGKKEILTIVLGSTQRFTDSEKFIQSIWKNVKW